MNGRIINAKYRPHSKSYAIPDEVFQDCFVSVTSKENNATLIKMIENLTDKVDENCGKYGYGIEKDIIDNVLVYMYCN